MQREHTRGLVLSFKQEHQQCTENHLSTNTQLDDSHLTQVKEQKNLAAGDNVSDFVIGSLKCIEGKPN